jgi:hypothetical protein
MMMMMLESLLLMCVIFCFGPKHARWTRTPDTSAKFCEAPRGHGANFSLLPHAILVDALAPKGQKLLPRHRLKRWTAPRQSCCTATFFGGDP